MLYEVITSLGGDPPVAAEAERVEVGRPPHRAHPFVISEAASELHLAGGFGWRSGLYLGAAVACGVWTILNWLTKMHLL